MKSYYFKCPVCSNDKSFRQFSEDSGGTGCALLFFGGILPALIYGVSRRSRIQCSSCNHIFRQPALPESSLSKLSKWIFIIILLAVFSMALFHVMPSLIDAARGNSFLKTMENFISSNPMLTAVGIAVMLTGILLTITIAMLISNFRFRKELKKEYLFSTLDEFRQRETENRETSINDSLPSVHDT